MDQSKPYKLKQEFEEDFNRIKWFQDHNKKENKKTIEEFETMKEMNKMRKRNLKRSKASKREKVTLGYLNQLLAGAPEQNQLKLGQTPKNVNKDLDVKRCSTANNFYKSDIFSKTSVNNAENGRPMTQAHQKVRPQTTNFIEKNMHMGRVSTINQRRFSGAFDHLNLFPTENRENDIQLRIRTMKRAATTARAGNRADINGFESYKDRSRTPVGIDSYRNYSINEK